MLRKQRLFQEGGPKTKQTKDEIPRRSGELIHSYFSSVTLNQIWVHLEVRNLDLTFSRGPFLGSEKLTEILTFGGWNSKIGDLRRLRYITDLPLKTFATFEAVWRKIKN